MNLAALSILETVNIKLTRVRAAKEIRKVNW